jgi:hypothetical protein
MGTTKQDAKKIQKCFQQLLPDQKRLINIRFSNSPHIGRFIYSPTGRKKRDRLVVMAVVPRHWMASVWELGIHNHCSFGVGNLFSGYVVLKFSECRGARVPHGVEIAGKAVLGGRFDCETPQLFDCYALKYGGKWWFSTVSPHRAFKAACEAVAQGLNV